MFRIAYSRMSKKEMSKKRPKRKRLGHIDSKRTLQSTVEPTHWRKVINLIEEQRKTVLAPVDTVGCEALTDRENYPPDVARYHCLTSLMLSSQTKDEVTAEAMTNLKAHGLTIENIMNTEESKINELIKRVGFHNRKATYIKKTALILHEKYKNDIPETLEDVLSLPGVGPKMGHILMNVAWNRAEGIGVDVHVHRICNRLGWVSSKTPEQTRVQLENWLPKEYWPTINKTLVGFGQTICRPIGPKCNECYVNELCPSACKVDSKKIKKQEK